MAATGPDLDQVLREGYDHPDEAAASVGREVGRSLVRGILGNLGR